MVTAASLLFSLLGLVAAQKLQQNQTCRITTFIPFTDQREGPPIDGIESIYGYGQWPDAVTQAKASFSLMAAAEMARIHFNERNAVIVPELGDLRGCPIQIPEESWYLDSAYDRKTATSSFYGLNEQAIAEGDVQRSTICGVIGPIQPRSTEGVAAITEVLQVPQIGYATIDRRLSRKDDFPSYSRIIPEANDFAETIAKYVQRDVWLRDFVAIIYDQNDYGEQFEDKLEDAEDTLGYETITEHFVEGDRSSIESALGEAKEKGYHTVILVTDREAMIAEVAAVAEEYGMLGEDFFWIISGEAFNLELLPTVRHQVDSPADKLLRGAAAFTNYDPFVYFGESDPFLQVWRAQDETMVNRLNRIQPTSDYGDLFYTAQPTYFQDETPTAYASFLYDAVIAMGLSACRALARGPPQLLDSHNRDTEHIRIVRELEFRGASGPKVNFRQEEDTDEEHKWANSRDPSGTYFGMYNIRPGEIDSDGLQSYTRVLTSVYSHENTYTHIDGTTENGAWNVLEEFVFYDGTTREPQPKIKVFDEHLLSRGVQVFGISMIGFSCLLTIAAATWVAIHRSKSYVRTGQPEFLYMLCFGAFLVALSLITMSFDEGSGWSEQQLTRSCRAFPWLFCVGYLIVGTLRDPSCLRLRISPVSPDVLCSFQQALATGEAPANAKATGTDQARTHSLLHHHRNLRDPPPSGTNILPIGLGT